MYRVLISVTSFLRSEHNVLNTSTKRQNILTSCQEKTVYTSDKSSIIEKLVIIIHSLINWLITAALLRTQGCRLDHMKLKNSTRRNTVNKVTDPKTLLKPQVHHSHSEHILTAQAYKTRKYSSITITISILRETRHKKSAASNSSAYTTQSISANSTNKASCHNGSKLKEVIE